MYLGFPEDAGEPPKQLKGFKKVMLAPGQKATMTFTLTERDVSIYEVSTHSWTKTSGKFGVSVGASSKDIRLTGKLTVV
jgi:beta-glucosidase